MLPSGEVCGIWGTLNHWESGCLRVKETYTSYISATLADCVSVVCNLVDLLIVLCRSAWLISCVCLCLKFAAGRNTDLLCLYGSCRSLRCPALVPLVTTFRATASGSVRTCQMKAARSRCGRDRSECCRTQRQTRGGASWFSKSSLRSRLIISRY